MLVEERIVDLARPRLVPAGIVGDLDVRDAVEVCLDGPGEIPLHDLHVVDIVLKIEVVRAHAVEDRQRLFGRAEEKPRYVARVDGFDQQLDPGLLQPVGGKLQVLDKDVPQFR